MIIRRCICAWRITAALVVDSLHQAEAGVEMRTRLQVAASVEAM